MIELCKRLSEPFDPTIVSWRVGPTTADKSKGMALAYVDARDVMRRLDEVCGPENWQDEYPWSDGKRVVCRIGVKLLTSDPANPDRQYEWVWKTDGAGDTDTEGGKGALSDAFKRAAVKWGIGRYLYDVDTPWVQIEKRGNSYIIPDGERAKLVAVLRRQAGQQPAAPPAGARNPAPPPSPVTNGNGAHTAPARDPELVRASQARDRIFEAIAKAGTPKIIDDILSINSVDLALIKDRGIATHDRLLQHAAARKNELLASA